MLQFAALFLRSDAFGLSLTQAHSVVGRKEINVQEKKKRKKKITNARYILRAIKARASYCGNHFVAASVTRKIQKYNVDTFILKNYLLLPVVIEQRV